MAVGTEYARWPTTKVQGTYKEGKCFIFELTGLMLFVACDPAISGGSFPYPIKCE